MRRTYDNLSWLDVAFATCVLGLPSIVFIWLLGLYTDTIVVDVWSTIITDIWFILIAVFLLCWALEMVIEVRR